MSLERRYYIHILTNWNNKVMYVGVTNNLHRRVFEHKNKLAHGFTRTYNVSKLVYIEDTSDVIAALTREKQIRKWSRTKKNALVGTINPAFMDLSGNRF